jgi:hypothetical protein
MGVSQNSPNVDNYYIGKGIVYVKLPGDADYVDIGNVPEFEFTPEIEKLDHFSSRAGVRSKDKSVVLEKAATLRMVMEEWTARNLSLALLGAVDNGNPDEVTIDIFSENSIQAAVKFVGTNEVGPKWTFEFPKVEFIPSAALNPISDEWGQIEVTGDVLFDDATQSWGTAKGDFAES